jgi:hypothetical protein
VGFSVAIGKTTVRIVVSFCVWEKLRMNGFVLALIAAVAGGLALVLFGKPKGEGQREADRVERIEPTLSPPASAPVTPAPVTPTVTTPTVTTPASTNKSATTASPIAKAPMTALPIADPWADEAPEPEPEIPAASPTPSPESAAVATTAIPLTTPKSTPTPPATATTAGTTPSMPPFAAIQDPKRPSTPELQDLSQEILEMGMSKQLRFVPKLTQYANHTDAKIRSYVAYALGQIALPHTVKAEIETIIPVLGKLSQDKDLAVRQMAIKALSSIQSPQVLPYLEKGLLSSAGSVQQMANAAIQKLKLQYDVKSSEFPPALQKKPQ